MSARPSLRDGVLRIQRGVPGLDEAARFRLATRVAKHWAVQALLLTVAVLVVVFTDAQGLTSVLVLAAAFGLAERWGRWTAAGVSAIAGFTLLTVSVARGRVSGVGLVLSVFAVLVWVLLAWMAGVAADERRRVRRQASAYVEELHKRALHDQLTGLANRELLTDRLVQAVHRADRHSSRIAVLFLDIDDFKLVNDSLGHAAGDQLLVEIARRLVVELRDTDTAARFGGDEFVLVCEDLHDDQEAIFIAERILEALRRPMSIAGRELTVAASVGISVPTPGAHGAQQLLQQADQAMYRAKQRGGGRYEVFDDMLQRHAVRRLNIELDLRQALARDELRLVFQPIVDLKASRIAGVEALLRWQHPERGLLQPADFLPIAENSQLMAPIGAWVLEHACEQLALWNKTVPTRLTMAVNVSSRQLSDGAFETELRNALSGSRVDPSQIHLEMTETVLLAATHSVRSQLVRATDAGVSVGLDDFGTGYSSLSLLKHFPVRFLKIDRSFVHGLGVNGDDTAITNVVIDLSRTIGVDTIAEGVENADQLARLRERGCCYAQGFHFSRPQPAEALSALLVAGTGITARE